MYRSKLFNIILNHRLTNLDCADEYVVQMCPELTKFLPSCHICEPKDANKAKAVKEDKKKGGEAIQGASLGEVMRVWVGTGAKVAPQQVKILHLLGLI